MSEHTKDSPLDQHEWVNIIRFGVIVRRFCDECGVTPKEWLDRQPITISQDRESDPRGPA